MKRFLAILLAMMLIVAVLPTSALAASTKTVYVSRNGGNSRINLRTGPGYDYPESGNVARHNDKVTVKSTDGEWSKVTVKRSGKTGWIRTYYIDGTTKELGTGTKLINKATKVYAKADTKSTVKGSLTAGDTVKVYYTERDFARVTVTGSTLKGWIPMRVIGDTVNLIPEKPSTSDDIVYRVSTRGSNLNVRAGAGTGYKIINSLPNGTALKVLSSSGNWYKIKTFRGITGWVSKNYVVKMGYARVATHGSNLNVRKGPGTYAAVLGSLRNGTRVTIKSTSGNWAYITGGGLTGWVSMTWLAY